LTQQYSDIRESLPNNAHTDVDNFEPDPESISDDAMDVDAGDQTRLEESQPELVDFYRQNASQILNDFECVNTASPDWFVGLATMTSQVAIDSNVSDSLKRKIIKFWKTNPSDQTPLEQRFSCFKGLKIYMVNEESGDYKEIEPNFARRQRKAKLLIDGEDKNMLELQLGSDDSKKCKALATLITKIALEQKWSLFQGKTKIYKNNDSAIWKNRWIVGSRKDKKFDKNLDLAEKIKDYLSSKGGKSLTNASWELFLDPGDIDHQKIQNVN